MLERRSKLHANLVEYLLAKWPTLHILEEHKIGNNQFLDIYILPYKIGIEIHGIQHTKYIPFFHGDPKEANFDKQIIRDKRKQLLCMNQDIFYYAIHDNDKRKLDEIVIKLFQDYEEYLELKDVESKE